MMIELPNGNWAICKEIVTETAKEIVHQQEREKKKTYGIGQECVEL